MATDRGEQCTITLATVPESLEWEYLKDTYLKNVHEGYYGNIEFAFGIAKEAHSTLPARDTGEPSFSHPLMAAIYLVQAGCTHPSHIQAALLHDVPEDNIRYLLSAQERIDEARFGNNPYPYGGRDQNTAAFYLLEDHFGINTAEIVNGLTKSFPLAKTPEEKEEEKDYIAQLIHGPRGVWVVKAADRLHNLRTPRPGDIPRMLLKIQETRELFLPVFEMGAAAYPEGKVLLREIKNTMRRQEISFGQL